MQGILILGMPQYSVCPGGCRHVADALPNGNPISVTSAAYPGIYPKAAVVRPSSSRFMTAARGPEVTMLEDFSACLQQTHLLCGDAVPPRCLGRADASQDSASAFLLPSFFPAPAGHVTAVSPWGSSCAAILGEEGSREDISVATLCGQCQPVLCVQERWNGETG